MTSNPASVGHSPLERVKEPRPVDDPRALVPFGWAPGDYLCGECRDCKEPFSGDKRAWRCQDCAEKLRDAPPASVGPAPDGEGWIEWSGGENPVPGQMVEVRFRGMARPFSIKDPADWIWLHQGNDDDIIAYRIAPHPDREAEPTGGVAIVGVSLDGRQGEPAGMMTVKAHLSDGSEVVLIQDNGNVISHWKNTADLNGAVGGLREACQRMADDYQTSDAHHPHHVLVRKVDHDAVLSALSVSPPVVEGSSLRDTQPGSDGAVLVLKEPTTELMAEFANIDGPWCRGHMNCEQVWAALLDAQAEGTARARHQPTTPGEQGEEG